jgi:hypothetical protein
MWAYKMGERNQTATSCVLSLVRRRENIVVKDGEEIEMTKGNLDWDALGRDSDEHRAECTVASRAHRSSREPGGAARKTKV